MKIDITDLISEDLGMFSGSAAELGDNAGQITWRNALEYVTGNPIVPNADAARDYFESFGAWSADELKAMSDQEINALALQFIAGDVREIEGKCADDNGEIDWQEYGELASAGQLPGAYYAYNGRVYMDMDH